MKRVILIMMMAIFVYGCRGLPQVVSFDGTDINSPIERWQPRKQKIVDWYVSCWFWLEENNLSSGITIIGRDI